MGDTFEPEGTLRDLGYEFNDKGELRTIPGDEPFKFTTQAAYELLGDSVTHEVYDLLIKLGLQRIPLKKPNDVGPDELYSFVFASPRFDEKNTLLVLIHGSGVVRAGQWARKLILNETLDRGSQIPYIERALNNGWGVLVMNCNNNANKIDGERVPLKYSKTSEMHAKNAWHRFVAFSKCKEIFVVAHSRGGSDISEIMHSFPDEERVAVICLTDSWFEFSRSRRHHPIIINWAATRKDRLSRPKYGDPNHQKNVVQQLWAGTSEHERSSYAAIEAVFHVMERGIDRDNIDRVLAEAWDKLSPPEEEEEEDEGLEGGSDSGRSEELGGLDNANEAIDNNYYDDDEGEESELVVDDGKLVPEPPRVVVEEVVSTSVPDLPLNVNSSTDPDPQEEDERESTPTPPKKIKSEE